MEEGILVIVVEGKHSEFVAGALRGAFACGVVLEKGHRKCAGVLLSQGISVVLVLSEELAVRVKAGLVIFTEGFDGKAKPNYLIWEPSGSVEERDKIVEEAIRNLVRRKLLQSL